MSDEIIIEGDLILEEDYETDKNLIVKGDIYGKDGNRWNIHTRNIDAWNIDALHISAGKIHALHISAGNIHAWDISAGNIHAGNIDACDIICEKRIKKLPEAKTRARVYIQNKGKLKRKEHD